MMMMMLDSSKIRVAPSFGQPHEDQQRVFEKILYILPSYYNPDFQYNPRKTGIPSALTFPCGGDLLLGSRSVAAGGAVKCRGLGCMDTDPLGLAGAGTGSWIGPSVCATRDSARGVLKPLVPGLGPILEQAAAKSDSGDEEAWKQSGFGPCFDFSFLFRE